MTDARSEPLPTTGDYDSGVRASVAILGVLLVIAVLWLGRGVVSDRSRNGTDDRSPRPDS